MLRCFTSRSLQSSPLNPSDHCATSQGNSAAYTLRSDALSSNTLNLSYEFAKAVQTPSYKEMWSKIHVVDEWETKDVNHQEQFLAQLLNPNHEYIQEALQQASSNPFTQPLSTYFDQTERICRLLLILNQRIHQTRSLYARIHELIDFLPGDPNCLTQEQCNQAFDVLLTFQNTKNPFPNPETHKFNDMQRCFSDLKKQVDGSQHKPQSGERPVLCSTTGKSVCYIGTIAGFTLTAVSIVADALVARVAGSSYASGLTKSMQKDIAHIALLNAAARSAYVLHNELQTIGGLERSLQTAVESNMSYVSTGTSCGRERHLISKVVKHLADTHCNIHLQLTELEKHICLCFDAINRERSLLVQDIQLMRLQEGTTHTSKPV